MSKFNENIIPLFYTTPPFPSLYWPIRTGRVDAEYLYYLSDIWRFTVYWTLIFIGLAHLLVSIWAVLMQFISAFRKKSYLHSPAAQRHLTKKNRKLLGEHPVLDTVKWVWIVPLVWLTMATMEAFIAGNFVGLTLGAVYTAGYLKMSTWTPCLWGLVSMLVLIVSSFRLQGGL